MSKKKYKLLKAEVEMNSLSELTQSVTGESVGLNTHFGIAGVNPFVQPNSRLDTVFINTRQMLISNFRDTLNKAYAEYGIVKTLCEQPVRDAFRTGFTIKGRNLDTKQIQKLEYFYEKEQLNNKIIEALVWGRLYGGGGLVVNNGDRTERPLDIKRLRSKDKGGKLEFIPADMWELYPRNVKNMFNPFEDFNEDNYFNFYNNKVHPSRVLLTKGDTAPSMIKPRLRGWSLSVLEKAIRSINSYLKNQNLIFELLDEAKIDVYQMQGLNSALLTNGGTARVQSRIQNANLLKNYQNALLLDANDKYDQKQLSFNGLSEILTQIRQGLASDLKMPMTKLFGVSSAGFNSGEDDIENYNSMIESEIRSVAKFIIIDVLEICCKYLFDFVPEDLNIDFKPLRELSSEQEENKKNNSFNRLIEARANGLCSDYEFMLACNNENLLPFVFPETEIESAQNQNKTIVDYEPKQSNPSIWSRIFGKKEESEGRTGDDATLETEDGKGMKSISEAQGDINIGGKKEKKDYQVLEKTSEKPIDKQYKKFMAQETSGRMLKPIEPNQPIQPDKTGTVEEGLPLLSKFEKSNREKGAKDFQETPHKKLGTLSKFFAKHK